MGGGEKQKQMRNAGVPFDFAQGRLLHFATDDEAVRRSGRDDADYGCVGVERREKSGLEDAIEDGVYVG
jgi:hypothetical protein